MKISACYITKNEEKNILRSINSLKGICDEIIVVDTGSEDETIALAESAGARVAHFKWINDFSAARNYAISLATGDYIIFLDADEWFANPPGPEQKAILEKHASMGQQIFSIMFSDHFGDRIANPYAMVRIFKNTESIRYSGSIHENLHRHADHIFTDDAFLIYHCGYRQEIFQKKLDRNIELLEANLRRENRPKQKMPIYFYLAREHNSNKDVASARKYLTTFFEKYTPEMGIGNILIAAHNLRCSLVCEDVNSPDELCLSVVDEFIKAAPSYPSPYLWRAYYHYNRTGDVAQIIHNICKLRELCDKYSPIDFPGDIFSPLDNLNTADFIEGFTRVDISDRISGFDRLISGMQKAFNSDALCRLLSIISSQPHEEIILFLKSLREYTPEEARSLLVNLLYFPKLKDVFLSLAMEQMKKNGPVSDAAAIAAMITGDYDTPIKLAKMLPKREFNVESDVLSCVSCLLKDSEEQYSAISGELDSVRLMECYFKGTPLTNATKYEMVLLSNLFRLTMFLERQDVLDRLRIVMNNYPFELFYMQSMYWLNGGMPEKIVSSLTVDFDLHNDTSIANCYYTMGVAYLRTRDFNTAYTYLKKAFEHLSANHDIRRELGLLAHLSPAHAELVRQTVSGGDTQKQMKDDTTEAIRKVFSKERIAPRVH